jgi:hypothetical protein
MNRSQYLDDASRDPATTFVPDDVQIGNCDRQAEASWTRAAWIDELHAVTLGHLGLVRVAGHDDVEARSARVDVHFVHVMQDVNADTFQLKCEVERNLRCPLAPVVVSPDRIDRRQGTELFENLRAADVARMDDVLNARECANRLGAKQSVRV